MGISVAIATYNRAHELERTLLSLAQVDRVGLEEFEVLVVNNRSSDQTAEVVDLMTSRFSGRLRHIFETKQGLSYARNRAITEARYPVVAFVDDDVDFDRHWLRRLAAAFADEEPAAVGGRASLVYPKDRPAWLGDRDEGYLTKVELGVVRRLAEPDEIFGVNLAIHKEWFNRVGGFRTDLGRIGACLLSGEESDLLERIKAAGGRILYEPDAVVWHRVPPERLHRRWFYSRSYWGQRGEMRMIPESQVSAYEACRRTWHVALACKALTWSMLWHRPTGEECFHETRILAGRLGACVGMAGRLAKSFPKSRAGQRTGSPPRPVPTHAMALGKSGSIDPH